VLEIIFLIAALIAIVPLLSKINKARAHAPITEH